MNHGIMRRNSSYRNNTLDLQIAKQCAPLLAGIKISNLLIIDSYNLKSVYGIFANTHIKIKFLHRQNNRITLLLYKTTELWSYLEHEAALQVMIRLGYESLDLKEVLELFASRFSAYMKSGGSFPHEMGILLGYPVVDVVGFMEQEGKNFLYTGYWKVYGDLDQALDTFEKYKIAKEKITHMVLNDMTIKGIITLFKKEYITINNDMISII